MINRYVQEQREMETNLSGRLLVASPYLSDGNFMRSVVFIIKHNAEGAFGLSINRQSDRRFGSLIDIHQSEGKARDDDWIYVGGPVRGPLLALHRLPGVGEPCGTIAPDHQNSCLKMLDADFDQTQEDGTDNPFQSDDSLPINFDNPPAWITGDEDHLRILLKRCDAQVRFIVDYSGWGEGQLDEEMKVGGWLVCDADQDLLFGDHNTVWESAVRRCGHNILASMAPGIRFGDPNVN
jgi:putative transcriptional regulator